MKKFNFLFLGAAGLLLASCANEDLVNSNGNADGTANVTISLNAPQINSRAFSDGTTAQRLYYAIYDVTTLSTVTSPLTANDGSLSNTTTGEEFYLKKQKSFKLLTDHKYKFVFWAQSPNATAYTLNWTGGAGVTVDYDNLYCNDENIDAFYATLDLNITGDVQMDVDLYRPLAQINVGTNDITEAKALGREVKTSTMSVSNAWTKLDFITGAATEPTSSAVSFKEANIPAESETFPVDGYDYLAMAYVLVPKVEDKELITVSFDYTSEFEGQAENGTHTRTVTNVPVNRNYRTNIYGQILTSNAELIVEIVPDYLKPDKEPSALEMAAAIGGTVILQEDAVVEGGLTFVKDAIIDLNGNEIKTTGGIGDAITVKSGANLTLKNGTLPQNTNANGSSANIYVSSATPASVTLENMTITGNHPLFLNSSNSSNTITIKSGHYECTGTNGEAIYVQKGGKVIIEGGYFKNQGGTYGNFLLNIKDDYRKTLKDVREAIEVKGGIFVNYDPSDSSSENPTANFVADGYKVVVSKDGEDTLYTVVPEGTIEVNSENAATAFASGGNIILIEDVTVSVANFSESGEINLNDNKLTLSGNFSYDVKDGADIKFSNGEVDFSGLTGSNLNMQVHDGSSLTMEKITLTTKANGIVAQGTNANLKIVNSELKGDYMLISTNASVTNPPTPDYGQDANIYLESSKFSASTPLMNNVPANIYAKGCEFTGGIQGAFIRAGKATFENCSFITDNTMGSNPYRCKTWASGNTACISGVLIGNNVANSYKWNADVTFVGNNTINIKGVNANITPALHAACVQDYPASIKGISNLTIVYPDGVSMNEGYQQIEYSTSGIIVDGKSVEINCK